MITFAPAFEELFRPHRYKVFYGGRGSGKSWSVARALLLLGYEKPMRILCAREIQRSISDSVHKLLCEQIEAIGLSGAYTITRDAIRCTSGTEFIFKGLRSNPQEIKSTEGIDICWVEEAAAVSADSWDILIPTVRKPNSEIWLTFNPLDESDPTFQRFVLNAPDDAYVCKVNYDGNPAFPDVLKKEMEWLKARDYESYLHIWEGEVRKHSNAVIFAGRFRVEEFETDRDARFYQGADWGFACLGGDTLIMTDRGEKPIKDIIPGDMVLTRKGYKPVLHLLRRGIKDVYSLDYGGGTLTVTNDHRIFTADGWKQAQELKEIETVCVVTKSNLTAKSISDTQTGNTQTISIANGKAAGSITPQSIIGIYGNTTTGKSLPVMLSTTQTETHSTIQSKTLSVSRRFSTPKFTTRTIWGLSRRSKWRNIGGFTVTQKKTGRNAERNQLQQRKNGAAFAKSAESLSRSQTSIRNFVPQNAGRKATAGTHGANLSVKCAGRSLSRQAMTDERLALINAPMRLISLNEKQEVYDLTVEGEHEFFANGLLVHNCDPTCLVRCFIQDRTLYIDKEAWGVGVELDETPALFDTIETARKWPIKADNARPETISFMRRRGFNISAAKKWQGSIEDGIEFLKSYDIVIHPRCRHTIDEFNHYSYKVDKQTGEVLPIVVDSFNHIIDATRYALSDLMRGRGTMQINPAALMMR